MKRFVVTERGHAALPALDLDGDVVIGSGPSARLRLPAQIARESHVRIANDQWTAIAPVRIAGAERAPGDGGAIGEGIDLELGDYVVHVAPAPADVSASPPQRTESLARELVRGMLGAGAAPALELIRGPGSPSTRELPPPEAAIVVGRGDEATWVILDEDLSREHAEFRRGWDGVTIRDLGSKNGTHVDGKRITGSVLLADGARVELASCALVFRDPAERHLRGTQARPVPRVPSRADEPLVNASFSIAFLIAIAIAGLAIAGLLWIVAG